MKKIDWLELSARQLQILVTVLGEGSVTAAAARLEITQSAVSHALDRLRRITGDPLFVKSGRGIAATAQAEALGKKAEALLKEMQSFSYPGSFEPHRWHAEITIAANDFQRELLLPELARLLRERAPEVQLRVIDSAVPDINDLRQDHVQLVISPRPPDGTDIMQKKLFEDRYVVYYDETRRSAPKDEAQFLESQHATVAYGDGRKLDIDAYWISKGINRRFVVTVAGFAALPAFILGTTLVAVAPRMLCERTFYGLAYVEPPIPSPNLPIYAIWHARYQVDPAHRWLRSQLSEAVQNILD